MLLTLMEHTIKCHTRIEKHQTHTVHSSSAQQRIYLERMLLMAVASLSSTILSFLGDIFLIVACHDCEDITLLLEEGQEILIGNCSSPYDGNEKC